MWSEQFPSCFFCLEFVGISWISKFIVFNQVWTNFSHKVLKYFFLNSPFPSRTCRGGHTERPHHLLLPFSIIIFQLFFLTILFWKISIILSLNLLIYLVPGLSSIRSLRCYFALLLFFGLVWFFNIVIFFSIYLIWLF